MKRMLLFLVGMFLAAGWLVPPAGQAAAGPPAKGDPFPALMLPAPKSVDEKNYLGLSGSGAFKISQIKAQVALIEVFSMYCPFCQKDAPGLNELYRAIENNPQLKGKIKMIGIGAGNSPFEVDVFKKTYTVPFPLLPDEDFTLHKALGETRTPYFIAVKLGKAEAPRVVYSELAGFKEVESFLEMLVKASELR